MINGTKSISIKLTRISVGVAVLLGILISFGELVLDIAVQKTQSKASVALIVNAVSPLASEAAYELNADSAEDVISGLFAFPIILSAEILGDKDQVLARRKRSVDHTAPADLLDWAFSELEPLQLVLTHKYYDKPVGQLNVQIDTTQISEQVIERFFTSLIFGILRNIALAIILLFFFQKFLTRPIVALSKELEHLQIRPDKVEIIKKAENHEHDELGELVNSINYLLKSEFEIGQKLRQSQRMEAVGQLTGGIAHDFNNILGIIMGNLEFIERRVLQDEKTSSFVAEALNGVDRGAEITRKLLDYSRIDAGEEKLVSVNEFVEGMGELIDKSLAISVKTTTHLEANIWLVRINTGDLQNALLNLALNARDAMPNGGKLIIETSNKVLDEDYVLFLNSQIEAGEYVMISVSDTGAGMTMETCDKALEPFFTTKQEGKGTGLGLSMVYGFARRSGGDVKIYSEVGEGTTIRIYLPRAYENAEIKYEHPTRHLLPRGDETILVVDDEKAITRVVAANLESLGYKTLTSKNGEHALQLLVDNVNIDLLFSDIIMPGGMDGYQLALAAHKMRPSLKILLTSGFSKKRVEYISGEKEYLTELASHLVDKPYTQSDLAQAVRNTLDEVR